MLKAHTHTPPIVGQRVLAFYVQGQSCPSLLSSSGYHRRESSEYIRVFRPDGGKLQALSHPFHARRPSRARALQAGRG